MSKLRQAVIYSFASRYALRLIGLVSTMLVARLLTPAEIGTYGIASAIVMVASEFRLLGAGAYLVREREVTPEKIRSALGLTFIISGGLGLAIFAAAPWIADFYKMDEIATIFRILAITFLLAPYVSIPTALLQRGYEFPVLFKISLICSIVGFASTIGMILLGFSFYSLALGQVFNVAAEFLLILRFWPKGMPWMPQFTGLKPIASFGVFTSLVALIRRAHVTIPDMVIGKLGNSVQVAMFSRGLGFIEFLSQSIMMGVNPVALPYMSETKRNGGNMAAAYTQASILLGGVVCPVLAVAGLASVPTIRLFFGNQWDEAAPIASWLALWGIIRCIHWLSAMMLIAQGSERILLIKEIVVFAVFFAMMIMLFPYGLNAIAMGFVGVAVLDFFISALVLRSVMGLLFFPYLRAWAGNTGITLACAATTMLIGQFIDFNTRQFWIPILAIGLVLPVVWLLSLRIFKHPLYGEIERMLPDKLRRITSKA